MHDDQKTRKMALYAMMTALALIFSYVETLLPVSLGVPGAKLGLANLAGMLALWALGARAAVTVSVLRIVLSGFLFGNLFAITYALCGFAASILTVILLKKSGILGIIGVSAAGGVMHNIGQLACAVWLAGPYVLTYGPMLLAAGTVAGVVIGVLCGMIYQRIGRLLR